MNHASRGSKRSLSPIFLSRIGVSVANRYPAAKQLFVLAATYGQGEAPASAGEFLGKLEALQPSSLRYAVLGFGDRGFDRFCHYAHTVDTALASRGLQQILPIATVDRQAECDFLRWGEDLGPALGINLTLCHSPAYPQLRTLKLAKKQTFGQDVQAPVSILRLKNKRLFGLPRHQAGDLLGVLAPGEKVPRFYSLASSSADGFVEICVRRVNEGVCSSYLTNLVEGSEIRAFVKPNPNFRPSSNASSLVLIGAGAGIGPLMGFLRCKALARPTYLFWGGRHPRSDFLYESELNRMLQKGALTALETSFSRTKERAYVQDRLTEKAEELRTLIAGGAQILVCGGAAMGRDVSATLDGILAPVGVSIETLRSTKRYLDDVY